MMPLDMDLCIHSAIDLLSTMYPTCNDIELNFNGIIHIMYVEVHVYT